MITITNVRIISADANEGRLRAYATITIGDCLVITNVKIIEGPNGFFVSMPQRKRVDGTFADIVFPTNAETRKMIEEKVIEAFKKVVGESVIARSLSAKKITTV